MTRSVREWVNECICVSACLHCGFPRHHPLKYKPWHWRRLQKCWDCVYFDIQRPIGDDFLTFYPEAAVNTCEFCQCCHTQGTVCHLWLIPWKAHCKATLCARVCVCVCVCVCIALCESALSSPSPLILFDAAIGNLSRELLTHPSITQKSFNELFR